MIEVQIQGQLLTAWFTTGNIIDAKVVDGIPEGYELVDSKYNREQNYISLIFADQKLERKAIEFK